MDTWIQLSKHVWGNRKQARRGPYSPSHPTLGVAGAGYLWRGPDLSGMLFQALIASGQSQPGSLCPGELVRERQQGVMGRAG